MTYQKTGRPAGRPRKDGLPAGTKPGERPKGEVHEVGARDTAPPAFGRETALHQATGDLCKTCWPEGWPGMAVGLGCCHGSWIRRLPV